MASKIKEVKVVETSRVVNGTNFVKGDYIKRDKNYVVNTNDGRQCDISREGIIAMLAEVGVKVAIRITVQMLSKLAGHTLNESYVKEEGPRLYPRNK